MFGLVLHDYVKNKHWLQSIHLSKINALHQLEFFIFNYIYDKIGIENAHVKIHGTSYSENSSKWHTIKDNGYIITKDHSNPEKLQIFFKKIVAGILTNSISVKRIFEAEIIDYCTVQKQEFSAFDEVDEEIKEYFTKMIVPKLATAIQE